MKKIVQRMCMGCNEKKDKKELIRIVIDKEGNVCVDKTGKMPGRGAYVCDNEKCLNSIIKTKRVEKKFEKKIENEIYENIRGVIVDEKK